MRKKLLLAALGVVLVSLSVRAQQADETKGQTDSTLLRVNNGRQALLQALLANNTTAASELYGSLNRNAKDPSYSPFVYAEEICIDLLLQNWQEWLDKAANYREDAKAIGYPKAYPIYDSLYSKVALKCDTLRAAVTASALNNEDKGVLLLYLQLLKTGERDDAYGQMAKEARMQHATSRYHDFVSIYLPKQPVKGSISLALGATIFIPTGELHSRFAPRGVTFMALDFNIGRGYLSLYMTAGRLKLRNSISVVASAKTYDFAGDSNFSYFEGGVLAGYFVVHNSRFMLAPYLTVAGNNIESDIYTAAKDDSKELKVYRSFAAGPGIHSEVKLFDFGLGRGSSENALKNNISFRLDAGYNLAATTKLSEFKGDIGYLRMALAWGIGNFGPTQR
jgi:hypothetical protein